MTDTDVELEEQPCGLTEQHGPHVTSSHVSWSASGEADYHGSEYQCPGQGVITVSWSELDAFRQCPKKHDLAYLQRWQKDTEDTSALGKGSLWHRVKEVHYKTIMAHQVPSHMSTLGSHSSYQGMNWDCSANELEWHCINAVGALLAKFEAEQRDPEVIKLMRWMYVGYLEKWGLDEQWDIVAVESTHIVPLYEADGSESWVRLKVKLDLVVRDQRGRLWVVDHKSCGQLPGNKDFDWADQFKLYILGLNRIGMKVFGAIHSAARTTMNKGDILKPGDEGYKKTMRAQTLEERFARTALDYTPAELECIERDTLADFKLAYSDANHKRRRPNEEWCKWRCNFSEACMFGRRTGSEANTLDMLQRTGFTQEFTRH